MPPPELGPVLGAESFFEAEWADEEVATAPLLRALGPAWRAIEPGGPRESRAAPLAEPIKRRRRETRPQQPAVEVETDTNVEAMAEQRCALSSQRVGSYRSQSNQAPESPR